MNSRYLHLIVLLLSSILSIGQNPSQLTFNTQYPVISTNKYERATQQINLQPGYIYAATSSPQQLLNLSISTYTSPLISGNYLDPAAHTFPGFNPNTIVSSTDGKYEITPTGQFSYNLPIICSPGTNNVSPKLSVSYNSLGYNGLMGVGFNLSGISTISRIGYNRFQDGVSTGVTVGNSDQFCLDGSRLFLNTGSTYGANGSTYNLQCINYQTITSYGTQGNGPAYFEIKDPSGVIIEYGKTGNSALIANGDNTIYIWYINKITDEFGNYMNFIYTSNNGEVLIDKIEYTGNSVANLTPYNSITFSYIDRSDKNCIYAGGKKYNSTKLLQSITAKDLNNQIVHKYAFDYQFNIYSLLNKITEIDAEGNESNPTYFTWDEPATGSPGFVQSPFFDNIITTGSVNHVKDVVSADLNGDGYSDLVSIVSNDGLSQLGSGTLPNVTAPAEAWGAAVINNMSKGQTNASTGSITFDAVSKTQLVQTPADYVGHFGAFVIRPDKDKPIQNVAVISHCKNASAGSNYYTIDRIDLVGGSTIDSYQNFIGSSLDEPAMNNANHSNPNSFFYDINDYNGDGIDDQIVADQWGIYFNKGIASQFGGGFDPSVTQAYPNGVHQEYVGSDEVNPKCVKIGDFDGDGLPEFYVFKYWSYTNYPIGAFPVNSCVYEYRIYKVNSAGTAFVNTYSSPLFTSTSTTRLCLKAFGVGDLNGDGKTDIFLCGVSSQGKTEVHMSTGTGFDVVNMSIPAVSASDDVALTVCDLNGDSKSDIMIRKFTAYDSDGFPTSSNYTSYFSTGLDVISDNQVFSQNDRMPCSTFGDFNADGNMDYFGADYDIGNQFIRFNHFSNQKKNFLTEIKTPKKDLSIKYSYARNAYDYNSMAYNSAFYYSVYRTTNLGNPPFLVPSLYLVSQVIDNNRQTRFYYENAIFNDYGTTLFPYPAPSYQFMGFEKVISALRDLNPNPYSNTYLGTEKHFYYDNVKSVLYKTETISGLISYGGTNYQGGSGIIITNGVNFYPLKFPTMNSQTSKFTSTNYNILAPNQINNSGIHYRDKVETVNLNYLNSTNSSCITQFDNTKQGNVSQVTSSSFLWGTTTAIRSLSSVNTYAVVNGNYKLKNAVQTFNQINDSPFTRETEFNYDPQTGRLISKVADPNSPNLAVTTTFENINAFGSPTKITISATDVLPRTAYQYFDNTGRFAIQKTNALGNSEYNVFEPKYGNIVKNTDLSGLLTQYKYDGMGRLVETTKPSGAKSKNQYTWDNSGSFNGSYVVITTADGVPTSTQLFDRNNNSLKTETQGFGGNTTIQTNLYDEWNRLIESTDNHFANQSIFKVSKILYSDPFYRESEVKEYVRQYSDTYVGGIKFAYNNPSGQTYSKGFVKTTSIDAQSGGNLTAVKKENNAAGQVDKIINTDGSSQDKISNYLFSSNGETKQINLNFPDGGTAQTQIQYDVLGRQSALIDQSCGTTNYYYNSIGELTLQTTSNSNITITYDIIGRKLTKVNSVSGTTSYQYVTAGPGLQHIKQITGPNSTTSFAYDNLNRVIEQKEVIGTKTLKTNYAYDKYGKLVSYTFPSGYNVTYDYDNIGTLVAIKKGSLSIWQLNTEFAPSLISKYTYGNNKVTNIIYGAANNVELYKASSKYTTGSYYQNYTYNSSGAHKLIGRSVSDTHVFSYENFDYDEVDRLDRVWNYVGNTQNVNVLQDINYKDNGNIDYKSDAGSGTYVYGNTNQPNVVTNVSSPLTNISLNTLNISYNDIKKVSQITEMGTTKQMDFTYGNDEERIKVDYQENGTNKYTRYYAEAYEREETSTSYIEWNYIFSPSGLAAVNYNNNGTETLLYVTTDHLGSPLLLTDNTGNIVAQYSFDAWGRRRNPSDWTYSGFTTPQYLRRGFTFHEHIDEFGLINMNGRIYDPVLGRFLQADKIVQDPNNLQDFNRYSYAYNNPLKYTDPTGNFEGYDDAVVMGVGFIVGYVSYGIRHDDWGWKAAGNGLLYAAIFEVGYLTGGGGYGATAGTLMEGVEVTAPFLFSTGTNMMIAESGLSVSIYESENLNISASPMMGFGSGGATLGVALNIDGKVGNQRLGFGLGFGWNEGLNDLSGKASSHYYWNYGVNAGTVANNTYYGISYSANTFFGGNTNQGVAAVGLQIGDFSVRLDEDFIWDKGDRYRTGGLLMTYQVNKDVALAFGGSMITGEKGDGIIFEGPNGTWDPDTEIGGNRGGIMYGGIIYKNQAFFVGSNSENRLHKVQNAIHSNQVPVLNKFLHLSTPYFDDLYYGSKSYGYFGTYNRNYLYY